MYIILILIVNVREVVFRSYEIILIKKYIYMVYRYRSSNSNKI